jgi:hypothetical protein
MDSRISCSMESIDATRGECKRCRPVRAMFFSLDEVVQN